MCVICYIPKGVETPSYRVLRAMHNANPHGQGFCTPSQFSKGMNFDYFVEQLRKRSINEPCIMHFRWATHGSIKRANCHPFNINDVYFAHNGILSVRPMRDKTDSETAFIRYLYPLHRAVRPTFTRSRKDGAEHHRELKICLHAGRRRAPVWSL